MSDSQYVHPRVLKFNIGFLLVQGAGHQRDMELDLPRLRLDDDVELDFLTGTLRLSRNSRGVLAQGKLKTQIVGECVRCLEPITTPVELELEELFSYPPSPETPYSVDDTGILDLAPLLREEAILAVPMGALCRPDCAGLCLECGQNLNEATCDCKADDIDPRLAILRQLRE
ncbi:MAG: DUF177 domain-containing protein [Anaerolineae bacterium]|nr:DUF177 domain-containing protein [Anaerolineae bacterium]